MATLSAAAPKASPKAAPARKPAAAGATTRAVKGPIVPVKAAEPKAPARPRTPAKPVESDPPSQDLREEMIRNAAYFIAERHGFQGDPIQEWREAEAEIDQKLGRS